MYSKKNAIIMCGGSSVGKSAICKEFGKLPRNEYIELSEVYKIARQLCFQELCTIDKNLYNRYINYLDMMGDNFWSSVLFNSGNNYFMQVALSKMSPEQSKTLLDIIPAIKEFYNMKREQINCKRNKIVLETVKNAISKGNRISINVSNVEDLKIIQEISDLQAINVMCYCSLEETLNRSVTRNINALRNCVSSEWRSLEVIAKRFRNYINISADPGEPFSCIEIISRNIIYEVIRQSSLKIDQELISCASDLELILESMQDDNYVNSIVEIYLINSKHSDKVYLSIAQNVQYDIIVKCDQYSSYELARYFNNLIN